jgi:hypothetical protein
MNLLLLATISAVVLIFEPRILPNFKLSLSITKYLKIYVFIEAPDYFLMEALRLL